MRHVIPVAILAVACCWVQPARAQVIAAEDFEGYAAGSELAGQAGGSGFDGDWQVNRPL